MKAPDSRHICLLCFVSVYIIYIFFLLVNYVLWITKFSALAFIFNKFNDQNSLKYNESPGQQPCSFIISTHEINLFI